MEGLAAVTARIAHIQAMHAPAALRPPAASSATAAPTTFADALRSAQQASPLGANPLTAAPLSGAAALTGPGQLSSPAQLSALARLSTAGQLAATAPSSPPAGVSGGTRAEVAAFKAAWPNGRIPADVLTPIGVGGHRLAGPAAPAFEKMAAAAARDGVRFGVNDSYRPFEDQVALARSKGLYSQGGLAARPGTSQHGWGLAVDLSLDPKAQAWMRANGPSFGFHEDVPREPWHWTFQGV